MHTIKITPNLLFEYQCTSGKFIRLPNRIESKKNRFGSENRIESKLFLPELECSTAQQTQWCCEQAHRNTILRGFPPRLPWVSIINTRLRIKRVKLQLSRFCERTALQQWTLCWRTLFHSLGSYDLAIFRRGVVSDLGLGAPGVGGPRLIELAAK